MWRGTPTGLSLSSPTIPASSGLPTASPTWTTAELSTSSLAMPKNMRRDKEGHVDDAQVAVAAIGCHRAPGRRRRGRGGKLDPGPHGASHGIGAVPLCLLYRRGWHGRDQHREHCHRYACPWHRGLHLREVGRLGERRR